MNRLFQIGLSTVFGVISSSILSQHSAQAQQTANSLVVPMVSIPVTGGQFSVDLNIQNGQVQSYRYTNNQLPTLLTPVGTINLQAATVPAISPYDTQPIEAFFQGDTTVKPEALRLGRDPKQVVTAMQVTGSSQLNDGRSANFENTNAFLAGSAVASSPYPIESIGTATDPDRAHVRTSLMYQPLPRTYQGTIQVTVQSGGVMVPKSSFSAAAPTEKQLALASGSFQFGNNQRFIGNVANRPSGTQPIVSESMGMNVEDTFLINADGGQMTLISPDGEMRLTMKNTTYLLYGGIEPELTAYDGTKYIGLPWTGTVSGTVTLSDGQQLKVQDRLMSFYMRILFNPETNTARNEIFGGEFYADSTAIIPPIPTKPTPIAPPALPEPTPIIEAVPLPTPEKQPSILADTTVVNQAPANAPPPPIVTRPQPLANSRQVMDIMASPLSSSRIFPDMGALR
jgi:hypothetical protein